MKRIQATLARTKDGFYNAFCVEEMFNGGGDTEEEAKKDMLEQMEFFKQASKEDGDPYPAFLDEEFEIVYTRDIQSYLEYYSGIITLSGLEKLTGINQKQLWRYVNGKTKPRPEQVKKIVEGLHKLGQDLVKLEL